MPKNGLSVLHSRVNEAKKRIVTDELTNQNGNRTLTARALGVHRTYLQWLMGKLGIDIAPPPRSDYSLKAREKKL
jgi:DNA-binding NtrC family response regulator